MTDWSYRIEAFCKWLLRMPFALVAIPAFGQTTEVLFMARMGRFSAGPGDLVRENAKDKGNLFDGIDLGGSAVISYRFTSHWSMSGEVGYTYGRRSFQLPCKCPHPQDRVIVLDNDLQWGSVEPVVSIDYRSKRESYWYGRIGVGLSLVAKAKREVTYYVDFLGNQPDSTGTIESPSTYALLSETGSSWGVLWDAAFGHKFMSSAMPIWLEAYYRGDISDWRYELDYFQNITQVITLNRVSFGIRASFLLCGSKTPIGVD